MHSSENNSNSIGKALFHAAVQLTVPTVTSTSSIVAKSRSSSIDQESSRTRKTRYSLASLSISFPKYSHSIKRKTTPDVPIQTESKTTTTTTDDHLSVNRSGHYSRSTSCSASKSNKSPNDQVQSTKHTNECRKKNITPRWRTFSKVVTSLLTFTRTKKERYEWIQLVGHPGTFKEGIHDGYVLKQLSEYEKDCCELLQNDLLKKFVPKYNGIIKDHEGKLFIELEDLLSTFNEPCIMDCKIGVRTYLEEELEKTEPRPDLYDKMIAIDPSAPTDKEHEEKKITKGRYMTWRESLSSTEDLGFRIEAIKKSHGLMSKEFQRIKERNDVKKQFCEFINYSLPRANAYLNRLIELRSACAYSKFIQTHELIGSSILFVHDENKASLCMIDFGKTRLLPNDIHITHRKPWTRGSHEDGYLIGLNNLISLFQEIIDDLRLI